MQSGCALDLPHEGKHRIHLLLHGALKACPNICFRMSKTERLFAKIYHRAPVHVDNTFCVACEYFFLIPTYEPLPVSQRAHKRFPRPLHLQGDGLKVVKHKWTSCLFACIASEWALWLEFVYVNLRFHAYVVAWKLGLPQKCPAAVCTRCHPSCLLARPGIVLSIVSILC